MPRATEVTPESGMTAEQRRVFEAIAGGPRGGAGSLYKVMLHSPQMTDRVQALGAYLRFGSTLNKRISELATLVTARFLACRYEWVSHQQWCRQAGLTEEVIQAILERRRPAFSQADEEAAYDVLMELHQHHQVSDASFQQAVRHFGIPGTCELVGLAGYYTLLGLFLKAFQIEPPGNPPRPFED
ncbi:MAG: carboxymuconolactone decarboxylase family protein [Candidatus Lambdaproteobacteria bacterium]|nr:carboxymuconolactone decarboxylase family protein [Candidatus Lambdaproteobacteria bacterium]